MKSDKHLNKIKSFFSKKDWFDSVYSTTYKNEYIIVVKKYPYTKDRLFSEYEKNNNVRIRIHAI